MKFMIYMHFFHSPSMSTDRVIDSPGHESGPRDTRAVRDRSLHHAKAVTQEMYFFPNHVHTFAMYSNKKALLMRNLHV